MKKPLILITDDEPNIRLMLRTTLEADGFIVDEAADGRAALDLIDHDLPDLMVLDLSMPVMDGMSVLHELKDRPASRKPPVVVLTAYGSVSKAVQAIRLGARDFLEKPITPDDLRKIVGQVLDEPRAGDVELPPTYDQVLSQVREAFRDEKFVDAESLLMKAGAIAPHDDAVFLNLAGVFHEAMGRKDAAKRYYGQAIRANSRYEPAQQNMRRMYEFKQFGSTRQAVALGDEPVFAYPVNDPPPAGLVDKLLRIISG